MRILYSHRIQSRDSQAVHVEETIAALGEARHEVRVVGPSFYAESDVGGSSRRADLSRRLLLGALGEVAELLYNIPYFFKALDVAAAEQVLGVRARGDAPSGISRLMASDCAAALRPATTAMRACIWWRPSPAVCKR